MTETTTTANDLKERITAHIQELAEATDAARVSREMLAYLDTCARFHRYSPLNVWLILMSRPDAKMVAGYKKWQGMSRQVRHGEKGIAILAPVLVKHLNEQGEEVQQLTGFKTVYVFDISQTDGEPLPEPPDWKSAEQNAVLQQRLVQFANAKGITVKQEALPGEIQGVSLGGLILLSPGAGTKTLVHELAHELLHSMEDAPPDKVIRELKAESVAYVVCKHFGLDGLTSPNYVALHGADAGLIMSHLERIRNTAAQIIRALEVEPELAF